MNWSLELSPLLPWPVLAGAAACALLLVGLLAWRRSRGTLLRTISLAALLGALANPTLRQEQREPLNNLALVVVDKSASQSLAGRPERTAAVLQALRERLAKVSGLETRVIDAAVPKDPEHDSTEIFADVARMLSTLPVDRLAGVIVVTDGRVHDAPRSVTALGIDAPVHALITGAEGEFDRRIVVTKAPRYGLVGSEANAEIKVESSLGSTDNRGPVRLVIKREGQPDMEQQVAIGETIPVPLLFKHAGPNIAEVELAPVPGELTAANNTLVLQAEGVRENLRVLLVSGEPHAGERTWRNLLKSDAAVDLVHFTILRPPQKQDNTPINELSLIAFPTRELFQEKLSEFDLIIFDRYQRRDILPALYIDNVARYVEENGGAVLVAAGEDYSVPGTLYDSPLSQVLPAAPTGRVIEQPFKPMITAEGARHPVTQGLPGSEGKEPSWGRWFRLIETDKLEGTTVMSGPEDRPLLVLSRKGEGRVALLLSDHAWLWARGYEGGGPYAQLLRRLSHWLMKEPELEEERLSARVHGLKVMIERRTMQDTAPPVTVTGPDGKSREVTLTAQAPGLWAATLDAPDQGLYKLQSGNLSAVALSGSVNSREMAQVTASAEEMKPLLDSSGGGAYWTASAPGADPAAAVVPRISMLTSARTFNGSGWLGLKNRDAHIVKGVSLTPLFSGFAALALLLGLVSLTWWREGR